MNCQSQQIRGSIVVSISACHAEDPGSIPGCVAFLLIRPWSCHCHQDIAKQPGTRLAGTSLEWRTLAIWPPGGSTHPSAPESGNIGPGSEFRNTTNTVKCHNCFNLIANMSCRSHQIRGSIVVSISACHAEDPGSIPGRGAFC